MPTIRPRPSAPKPIRPIRLVPDPDVLRIPREGLTGEPASPPDLVPSAPGGD